MSNCIFVKQDEKNKALFSKEILKAPKPIMAGSPVWNKEEKKKETFKPFMVETNNHKKHLRSWESVQLSLCKFLSKNPLLQQRFGGKPSSFLSTEYKKPLSVPLVTVAEILLHS